MDERKKRKERKRKCDPLTKNIHSLDKSGMIAKHRAVLFPEMELITPNFW